MVSTKTTELNSLLQGYELCAQTEGKSRNAFAIVANIVTYLQLFLCSEGRSVDVKEIHTSDLRAFILHLQQKQCFSGHRFNHTQDRILSGHTINCYLRSIRLFFS